MTDSFHVGDLAVIVSRFGPTKISKVAEIKAYKRGPKVVLADGSEWDVKGRCKWGDRGDRIKHRHIRLWTPELQAQLVDRQRRNAVEWAGEQWDKLTPEQQAAVGDAARAARREKVEQ